ncbi:hypothetical protein D3C86_1564420 [compost metagenome]
MSRRRSSLGCGRACGKFAVADRLCMWRAPPSILPCCAWAMTGSRSTAGVAARPNTSWNLPRSLLRPRPPRSCSAITTAATSTSSMPPNISSKVRRPSMAKRPGHVARRQRSRCLSRCSIVMIRPWPSACSSTTSAVIQSCCCFEKAAISY